MHACTPVESTKSTQLDVEIKSCSFLHFSMRFSSYGAEQMCGNLHRRKL